MQDMLILLQPWYQETQQDIEGYYVPMFDACNNRCYPRIKDDNYLLLLDGLKALVPASRSEAKTRSPRPVYFRRL